MNTPDGLPTLSAGAHDPGEGKACVMEYVSLLAGERWSDRPTCTLGVLADNAQDVNDLIDDEHRHLLVPLIGRLFGTADGAEHERQLVRLAHKMWNDVPWLAGQKRLDPHAMIALLSDLLDEYDRLTGRTSHREVTDDELRDLRSRVDSMAVSS